MALIATNYTYEQGGAAVRPRRFPHRRSIARGDDGIVALFAYVPPWSMAPRNTFFPVSQSDVRGAAPSYNAGPQVGSIFSQPGIKNAMLLKAAPGTLFAVSVITAGTTPGGAHDANVMAPSADNQVFVIPNAIGITVLDWPCQRGILIVPGVGQELAVKWV